MAIKSIRKEKIKDEQDMVHIRREIEIMSSLRHPHIISIYEGMPSLYVLLKTELLNLTYFPRVCFMLSVGPLFCFVFQFGMVLSVFESKRKTTNYISENWTDLGIAGCNFVNLITRGWCKIQVFKEVVYFSTLSEVAIWSECFSPPMSFI